MNLGTSTFELIPDDPPVRPECLLLVKVYLLIEAFIPFAIVVKNNLALLGVGKSALDSKLLGGKPGRHFVRSLRDGQLLGQDQRR